MKKLICLLLITISPVFGATPDKPDKIAQGDNFGVWASKINEFQDIYYTNVANWFAESAATSNKFIGMAVATSNEMYSVYIAASNQLAIASGLPTIIAATNDIYNTIAATSNTLNTLIGSTTTPLAERLDLVEANKPDFVGSGSDGNVVAYSGSGLYDTGYSADNFGWQVGYTNVSQILSSVGKPNGIARLDENGKIDATLVESLYITFSGGPATDRSL